MPLADVTRCFKDGGVDWALRGRAFKSQFNGRVDPVRGVYAHLDVNYSELPIYDKNGPGKVIVFGSAMALKFGKFVGGLSERMLQNNDHFHRRRPDGSREESIFASVLTCLFVLDLSHHLHDEIRPIETLWNRGIRAEPVDGARMRFQQWQQGQGATLDAQHLGDDFLVSHLSIARESMSQKQEEWLQSGSHTSHRWDHE